MSFSRPDSYTPPEIVSVLKDKTEPVREHPGEFVWFDKEIAAEEVERAYFQKVMSVIENPDAYINEGMNGRVYRFSEGICFKVLKIKKNTDGHHVVRPGKGIEFEARALMQASKLSIEGVRSPRCFGYWKLRNNEDEEFSVLFMEELDAVNLLDVTNKKIAPPATFQQQGFLDALSDYLDELQQSGIFHMDFEARNVMIDRETGLPRVIDFGSVRFVQDVNPSDRKVCEDKDWKDFRGIVKRVEDAQLDK